MSNPAGLPALSRRDFERFQTLAHDKFGLSLGDAKRELVASRLGKKLCELRLSSFRDYYDLVVADKTGESLTALIDALATNHTLFLREAAHFEFLREVLLPTLRRRPRIDVWSAPCSTGEEPFSIAMVLFEELGAAPRPPFAIHAVDISTKALATARAGVYAASRLAGVPSHLRAKYFRPAKPGVFEVAPHLRHAVEFERVNLIEPIRDARIYPLIFCRNLLIYFDKPTQQKVVRQLVRRLEPGGHIFFGHSESLIGVEHPLEYVKPAIYRLPEKRR